MALFWVGGTGNWSDATNHWATSSGGAPGAGNLPTATDDVTFDTLSHTAAYTVTIDATTKLCRDITFGAPLTGNVTWAGSVAMTISGSLALYAGLVRTYTGTLTFDSTATGKTIACAGVTLASSVTFNGVGGGWTLSDALNIGTLSTVTLTAGTLNTNGMTVTAQTMTISGSTTRTVTLGASAINVSVGWTATTTTNLTFNVNTSTITISNSGTNTFLGGGLTYNNVVFTGAGNPGTISGANTFANLTATMSGVNSIRFELSANQVVTGTLTATGVSAGGGRVRFASDIRGTQRTITAANVALTNVDFADTVGAGAASWTGTSIGDAENNSNITFTAAVTRYYVGGTGSWSATSEWSTTSGGGTGASAPLCHDTAVFDASSFSADGQVLTIDGGFYPTMDFTNIDQNVTLTLTGAPYLIGGFILRAGMTVTAAVPIMFGLGTTSVDFAGITLDLGNWTINIGTGTLTVLSNLTLGSTRNISLESGTFNQNNFNVTTGLFRDLGTTTAKVLAQGTGTLFVNGTGSVVSLTGTGFSITGTGTIDVSANTATARTVSLNSQPINNLKISNGTSNVTLTNVSCQDLNFTGYTGLLLNGTTIITVAGNLTFGTGMTSQNSTNAITMSATSGTKTITSNSVTLNRPVTLNGVGGTFQLVGNVNTGVNRAITLTNGTLDMNNVDYTGFSFVSSNSNTRAVTNNTGTWTLTGTGTVWNITTSTGMTFSAGSSTIKITNTSATARTFAGGGLTYNNLWISPGAGTATQNFTGSNTFVDFRDDGSAAHSVIFTAGTTTTSTSWTGFTGNLVTIGSITAANHNLVKSGGGVISVAPAAISRSQASPGSTWYAGASATDGGNNTGWIFTSPPVGSTTNFFLVF